MTRLIDADDFFRTFPELAIDPYINAPTVDADLCEYSDKLWKAAYERGKNERPHGECKNCKAYRQYGSRADGYCNISRMTPEGETFINVNEKFFCSYFREADK